FPGEARLAIRCSGTEPKVKFYLFHRTEAEDDLRALEKRAEALLSSWWQTIDAEVGRRLS
ncbi:MAG: hypothetical protein PHP75_09625, partial [Methylacidiphilaceae bacterium]|nr:hypothetical protein [Candidatus Methylacidiphilaceae bacterium]